jgi:hypothetical protein
MAEEKGDPREMRNSPYKEKAEKLATEWYKDLDIILGDKINLPQMMEYWITYRLISIYEHHDIAPRGLDSTGNMLGTEDKDESGSE